MTAKQTVAATPSLFDLEEEQTDALTPKAASKPAKQQPERKMTAEKRTTSKRSPAKKGEKGKGKPPANDSADDPAEEDGEEDGDVENGEDVASEVEAGSDAGESSDKSAKPAKSAPRAEKTGTRKSAAEMATRQRDISVAEFFTKNRHLLGFDSPLKALLTAVKEAVDNSLDAC